MTSPAKLLGAARNRCRKILELRSEDMRLAEEMVTMLIESLARAERAIANGDRAEIVLAWEDLSEYGD